jgi:hypothetical protein
MIEFVSDDRVHAVDRVCEIDRDGGKSHLESTKP